MLYLLLVFCIGSCLDALQRKQQNLAMDAITVALAQPGQMMCVRMIIIFLGELDVYPLPYIVNTTVGNALATCVAMTLATRNHDGPIPPVFA